MAGAITTISPRVCIVITAFYLFFIAAEFLFFVWYTLFTFYGEKVGQLSSGNIRKSRSKAKRKKKRKRRRKENILDNYIRVSEDSLEMHGHTEIAQGYAPRP
jgi:hypothetical protein